MSVSITVDGKVWIADSLDDAPEDAKRALIACYSMGGTPKIEPVTTFAIPMTDPATLPSAAGVRAVPQPIGHDIPFPETRPVTGSALGFSAGWDNPGKGDVLDVSAKARIEAQHAALISAGVEVKSESQVAATGTRMMRLGYENQAARKAEHDAKLPIEQVAAEITARIASEHREDIEMSAAELSRSITVNGKIHVGGRALTEQAIRGLAARLESPMLGYLLGLRERMIAEPKHPMVQADKERIAEVLRHECARNPSVKLQLRTRNGGSDDVYACVSPSYVEADATTILPEILGALDPSTRATFAYDPASTQWEIRASVWTPTPVEEQAIGEAFEGYVSLRSRDNGTSKFRGDGGVTLIACYNAGTYNAGGAAVSRVHRGRVSRDVDAMIATATKSIGALCNAWGMARAAEIPMTPEERAEGDKFLSALWLDMLKSKPLEGVLVGRKADHVSGLVSAYHAERRDHDKLVRADMAQSWTRYIQNQPADVRRDAEAAIGSWLVGAS